MFVYAIKDIYQIFDTIHPSSANLFILDTEYKLISFIFVTDHFQNLNISLIDETNKITYQKTIQEKVYVVTESISPPVEARYVHMFNPTDGHFVLCEISVYGGKNLDTHLQAF